MQKIINLLWTGGWDSTYRLLELSIVQRKKVQPYYIISRPRKTWEVEVRTMDKIRSVLFKKFPYTKSLILPTIFKEREEIKQFDFISEQYKRLSALGHLGDQHEYISRYAEEIGVFDLEMCIDTRSPGFFTTNVKPNLVKEEDDEGYNFGLVENPSNPDLAFFKYFKFPIHEYTKKDLRELSKKNGFLDILELSWFCHTPVKDQPCGVCTPCKVTMEHGMSRRIPLSGLFRNFIWYTVKPPVKKLLKPENKGAVSV